MINSKFKTETISANTHLLIINDGSPIGDEVQKILREKKNITLGSITEFPALIKRSPNIILNFLDFQNKSAKKLSAILKKTRHLLEFCTRHSITLYLIVPAIASSIKNEIQKETIKYSQKFTLKYKIISVDLNEEKTEIANQIVSTFYYGHQKQTTVTDFKSTPIVEIGKKPARVRASVVAVVFFISLLLLSVVQIFTVHLLGNCSIDSFQKIFASRTWNCSYLVSKLVRITYPQVVMLPGLKSLLTNFGYPPEKVVNLYTSLTESQVVYSELIKLISINKIPKINDLKYLFNANTENLGFLQNSLKDYYLSTSNPPKNLLTLSQKVVTSRSLFSKAGLILNDFDKIFPDKKVNYLIILQDNAELRPTGGYLDSFIILTYESGKLVQTQSFTTSQADGLLVGQVTPPATFQEATGEKQWFLRDANWDPDFPTSARRIAWFVEKELSVNIDGVLAVNTGLFPELLKIVGPLKTTETGKIFQNIFDSIPKLSSSQLSKLFLMLANQFEFRQVMFSPTTYNLDSLEKTGWNGGLKTPSCLTQAPCVEDYYYSVDSNVGVNKVDSFIKRNSKLDIQFSPSDIRSSARLTYENTSEDTNSGGVYKNYFRMYLPADIALDSLIVNNQVLAPDKYLVSYDQGFLVIGTLIYVPPKSSAEIIISYHRPILTTGQFHYLLKTPPQPGIVKKQTQISLNYPPNWTVISFITPKALISPVVTAGLLRYNAETGQLSELSFDITPTL